MWQVDHWPLPTFHVFLSHCKEDKDWLVVRVRDKLKTAGIEAWYDTDHYPAAADPVGALQDGLLKCRHCVFLVTSAYLEQVRGWTYWELAFASVVQANLRSQTQLLDYMYPISLAPRDHGAFGRSAWQSVEPSKWKFIEPGCSDAHTPDIQDTAVAAVVAPIRDFVVQKQAFADAMLDRMNSDAVLAMEVKGPGRGVIDLNRKNRILMLDTIRLP